MQATFPAADLPKPPGPPIGTGSRHPALVILLGIVLILVACSKEPNSDFVYRHALDGVPGSLDPVHAGDIYSSTIVLNIFDTLFRYRYLARPYELAPNLASEMPSVSDDGLTWTIRLRPGVQFADDPAFGPARTREVVASDVIYSLRRHFDPDVRSRTAWLLRDRIAGLDAWGSDGASPDAAISGLEATDEHTLRITLSAPFPQLLNVLAMAPMAIVPREAVEAYGPEFGVQPVGSGPFHMVRRDETRAVLEPNRHFRREPLDLAAEGFDPVAHGAYGLTHLAGRKYPMIDRLEFHFISEPSSRWYSFTGGEIDNVTVAPDQASRVLEQTQPLDFKQNIEERFHGLITPESGFVFHGFNMNNPAIGHHPDPQQDDRNRALRCAMRDGFNWSERIRSFDHGLGTPFSGALSPILAAHDPEQGSIGTEFEPERARQRLQQAGWSSDEWPTLSYGLESNLQQRQMYEQFRAWMMALGMPANRLQARSFASFSDYLGAIGRREIDLFLMSWTLAYPDPQYAFQLFHGPNAAPGANSFNYSNPEFDQLFEQASALADSSESRAMYRQLNRILVDDCVIIGSMVRTRIQLWNRQLAMLPDRDILGGYFIRFVGPAE